MYNSVLYINLNKKTTCQNENMEEVDTWTKRNKKIPTVWDVLRMQKTDYLKNGHN